MALRIVSAEDINFTLEHLARVRFDFHFIMFAVRVLYYFYLKRTKRWLEGATQIWHLPPFPPLLTRDELDFNPISWPLVLISSSKG